MEKKLGVDMPPVRIKLSDTTEVICDKCGCNIFTSGLLLRKVSKFLTGSDRDNMAPMEVLYCVRCQNINKDMMPSMLGDNE